MLYCILLRQVSHWSWMELGDFARVAGQWAQGIFLSLSPQNLDYKYTRLCLHFTWGLGIWTQVLRFVWEVLHWLSHLPCHVKPILRKRRLEVRRSALANMICPGEIRFSSQSQTPTPTNSILCTLSGLLKGKAIRVLEDRGEFDLASQDSVWLGLERIISSAMDSDFSCAYLWHPALVWCQFPSTSSQWARRELKCLGLTFLPPLPLALCGAEPIINQAGRQRK